MVDSSSPIVLVADDELLIRWALRERLTDAGFRVVEASRASEARAGFDESIDAVVLDLRLPDGSGLDLLREFHGLRPEVPLILISAWLGGSSVDEAVELGATAVLSKPFDVEAVLTAIRDALAAD